MEILAVIGLGYVGIPLSVLFSNHYKVIGYDINKQRVDELQKGIDATQSVALDTLHAVLKLNEEDWQSSNKGLKLVHEIGAIQEATTYIITVPTPDDEAHCLDMTLLESACRQVASVLERGNLVIIESTVYPGVTENICIPILEQGSGLKLNQDFGVNPGDTVNTIDTIVKLTSGSDANTAQRVKALYQRIISAGVHDTGTIQVAEASKLVENAQRDVNVAFVNEIAQICNAAQISTQAVLKAAATKWNFLPFKPGLVGGHCVGVASSYLMQLSSKYDYKAQLLQVSRNINNGMSTYIVQEIISLMVQRGIQIYDSEVLLMGVTFKENCPDLRNSKVIEMVALFKKQGVNITILDPMVDEESVSGLLAVPVYNALPNKEYDVIVLTVAHEAFKNINVLPYKKENAIIYDIKGVINAGVDKSL